MFADVFLFEGTAFVEVKVIIGINALKHLRSDSIDFIGSYHQTA